MDVRELHLYSPKIGSKDMEGFFNLIVSSRFPFLGFLSFSDIFSVNALNLILRRRENTLNLYLKDKPCLQNLSALIFPFRLCETSALKPARGSFFPIPKLYILAGAKADAMDFALKEDIEELSIGISKVFGRFLGVGAMTDTEGRKGLVILSSPAEFFKLDLEKNSSIYMELLEPLPKKMHMSSRFPVFEDTGMSVGVDNFDALQHSLIVGTSGSGKSKALYVLLRAMEAGQGSRARTIIIDPHGELAKMMPQAKIIDFSSSYIEPLDTGSEKSPMMTQLISQLITSTIGQENKYSERVLFYSIHLLSSIDRLDLGNISRLLTDQSAKAELVSLSDNAEVKRFFDEEFNDIYMHHFNSAILPILNFIGEYQLYLGKEKRRESLLQSLKENRTTIISFDPHFFGRRMIQFLSGAVINQMYILAITGKLEDKPTVLVVDEFPRVETRVVRDILAETRKFNLFAYLSCQYLGQLDKAIIDAMVSNVRNIIAFKLNRQDATMLSSIMEIKVEEYFKKSRAATELEESKKEMFVRLHQRECIVRLFDGTKYLLPMKMKVVDAARYGANQAQPPRARPPPSRPPEPPDAAPSGALREKMELPEPIIERELLENNAKAGDANADAGAESGGESAGGFAVYVSDDGTTIIKRKRKLKKSEYRL